MPTRLQLLQEDSYYRVLTLLASSPDVSQRELSLVLGVSLGSVNYSLRALMARGLVEMRKFRSSERKWSYAYLLTPQGVAEKAGLTRHFLQRKMQEYEALRLEIDALRHEVESEAAKSGAVQGAGL